MSTNKPAPPPPMMLAILSDVHANLEALQAVLADAKQRGATIFLSLGDHIGFNGDPAACLDLLIPLLQAAVQGNHEAELLHPGSFGIPLYERMMRLTAAMLRPEQHTWLASLPHSLDLNGLHLLHAPRQGSRWGRISSLPQATALLASQPARIILSGHTHRPTLFCQEAGTTSALPIAYDTTGSFTLPLTPTTRYLINPGSVGQPRDGDPRAAYALLDTNLTQLTLRRVPYDTQAAAAKICRTGLPPSFCAALQAGESPTGD